MKRAIILSFVFLGVYALAALLGWLHAALLLFCLSPVVTLWVVFKVLKDPSPVKKTFTESFYQDSEYLRNQG